MSFIYSRALVEIEAMRKSIKETLRKPLYNCA